MVAGSRGKGYKQRQGSRWLCILLLRVGGVHRTPSTPLVPTSAQLVPWAQGAASTPTNYMHPHLRYNAGKHLSSMYFITLGQNKLKRTHTSCFYSHLLFFDLQLSN